MKRNNFYIFAFFNVLVFSLVLIFGAGCTVVEEQHDAVNEEILALEEIPIYETYIETFNGWHPILGVTAEDFAEYHLQANSMLFSDIEEIAEKVGVPVEEVWRVVTMVLSAHDTTYDAAAIAELREQRNQ